jgi:hypothetical protein
MRFLDGKHRKKMQEQEQRQKQRRYSVASPFGLHSGLRQSGRPLRGWAGRWAEAQRYLKSKGKGKMRGFFPFGKLRVRMTSRRKGN